MTDVKISQLPGATTPLSGAEILPIVQSGATKQVSINNLTAGKAVSATSLALNGATIGSNALAVNGTAAISASLSINGAVVGSNALAITGSATISSSLAINGAAIGNNAFAVSGASYFNSQVYLGTGSATYPSIAHYNNDDTGLFFATDAVYVTTAGTTRLFIESDGKVGIGATPTTVFDVQAPQSIIRAYSTTGTNPAYMQCRNTGGLAYIGIDDSAGTAFGVPYAYGMFYTGAYPIAFATNSTIRMRVDKDGNVIVNEAAIATNATNGFLYVPTCAGVPTGTPASYTGRAPIVVDSTDNRLYFYSSGAWRNAGP